VSPSKKTSQQPSTWIPAYAGMTDRRTVTPAQAGVHARLKHSVVAALPQLLSFSGSGGVREQMNHSVVEKMRQFGNTILTWR